MTRPVVHPTTERIYARLPEFLRSSDERLSDGPDGYPLLRYLSLILDQLGVVDDLVDRIDYRMPADGGSVTTNEHYEFDAEDVASGNRIGTWVGHTNSIGHGAVYSDSAGASIGDTFTTKDGLFEFTLSWDSAADRGVGLLYIDETLAATVDQYASSTVYHSDVVAERHLFAGTHSWRFVRSGIENSPTSNLGRVDLEDIRITSINDTSDLADPAEADVAWLPWLGQLLGVQVNESLTGEERRAQVVNAASGWRSGTRSAIAEAAQTQLTGSKYVEVVAMENNDQWQIGIVTLAPETPLWNAVIDAITTRNAKPAGVILVHRFYSISWQTLESNFPTWNDLEGAGSWAAIESTPPLAQNWTEIEAFYANWTAIESAGSWAAIEAL